jgi:hypothetical protein
MKKSIIGLTVAGALLLGGYATSTFANSTDTTENKVVDFIKGKGFGFGKFFKGNSEDLLAQAKDLGIETSGKDAETLIPEIQEALIKKEAKELGISTTDKDLNTVASEIRLAKLQEEAKD